MDRSGVDLGVNAKGAVMTGSKIVDVAIALSFLYLLLSLVCSAINEIIAAVVGLRQRTLLRGIRRMLADSEPLRKALYEHPLIKSIHHGALPWTSKPSYMPKDVFASALLDVLKDPDKFKIKEDQIKEVKQSVSALMAGTKLGEKLDTAWGKLGDEIAKERQAVGQWFDDAMDRVSGVYKRSAQVIILAVGLVIALAMNVDSVTVTRSLWTDGKLRESVAIEASKYVSSDVQKAGSQASDFDAATKAANDKLAKANSKLEVLSLPLGWPDGNFLALRRDETWPGKLLGLLITILAISLGAPFWFDTVSLFVNLRGAGKKPAPSDPEPEHGAESRG